MSSFFQNKVAIVTGASSGIGKETARLLWQKGAKVVLAARRKEEIDSLCKDLSGSLAIPTDITKDSEVENLAHETVNCFGKIDILINNAGILLHKPISESTEEELRKVMEVNFFGAVRCINAILPIMKKQGGGTIANISSISGKIGLPNIAYYSSSKFALMGYSQALRQELKEYGIFVTTICPGIVYTPMNQELIDKARKEGRRVRFIQPQDVGQTILMAIEKKRPEIVLPKFTQLFFWAHFFFPQWIENLAWRFRASSRKKLNPG